MSQQSSACPMLFSPIKIGEMELKNRIILAPMVTRLGGKDGFIHQTEKDYFVRRATGGAALITVGDVIVAPNCQAGPFFNGIWDDKFIPKLDGFADAIHIAGSKLSIQLCHGGSQCFQAITGVEPVAPSDIVSPWTGEKTRALACQEIEKIVDQFADAAVRARSAGVDVIEIQGSQGFLLHNFMTPLFNKREDEYGGNLAGRMKFPLQVIKRIKEKAGPDYPLIFRMVVSDMTEGGIEVKDAILSTEMLTEAGADAIHLTAGAGLHMRDICQPPVDAGTGCIVDLVAQVKATADVPVIVVQRILDPMHAEKILEENKADMICLGRALICDPDWPRKAAQGAFDDIRKCVGCCQGCLDRSSQGKSFTCLYNPEVGQEKEYPIQQAEKLKKVTIVGGGPAGLEAARVAALRGHQVFLYEKNGFLGGQWFLACVPPKKREYHELIRYYTQQLRVLGVDIALNSEVTPAIIKQGNPDVVIVATGAAPVIPKIPGVNHDFVVTAHDILSNRGESIGNRVAILGGGSVGCETADFLSGQGKNITIFELLDNIAIEVGGIRRPFLIARLKQGNVNIFTSVLIDEILSTGHIMITDKDGNQTQIGGFDTVILALGAKSEDMISGQIKEMVPEVYVIGDAKNPRDALDAVSDGALVARGI